MACSFMKPLNAYVMLVAVIMALGIAIPPVSAADKSPAVPASDFVYTLSPGNRIKVTVFGEDDLSGEFEVDNTGTLSMPLIGNITVQGLTPRQLEELIADQLKDGYLLNPRISLEVLNFKPVFILGEVNKPGSYAYVNSMTVINAIALGGGYTYRASTGSVTIMREKDGKKIEIEGEETTPVYPGDTITVDERLF